MFYLNLQPTGVQGLKFIFFVDCFDMLYILPVLEMCDVLNRFCVIAIVIVPCRLMVVGGNTQLSLEQKLHLLNEATRYNVLLNVYSLCDDLYLRRPQHFHLSLF